MERSENIKQNVLSGVEDNIRSNTDQNLSIEVERAVEPEEITESVVETAKEEKKAEKALTEKEKQAVQAVVSTAKNMLQLTCDIDDVLTYATVHNGMHIVRDIYLCKIFDFAVDTAACKSIFSRSTVSIIFMDSDILMPMDNFLQKVLF